MILLKKIAQTYWAILHEFLWILSEFGAISPPYPALYFYALLSVLWMILYDKIIHIDTYGFS